MTSRKGATGSSTAGTSAGPLGGGGNGGAAGPSVLGGDKGAGDLGGAGGAGRAAGAPMDQDGKPGSGDVSGRNKSHQPSTYSLNCFSFRWKSKKGSRFLPRRPTC